MELLETQDPEKRKLIETSDRHRRELEKEVNDITARTERIVTNALIIGGSLALTYFVITRFTGSKQKKGKRVKPQKIVVSHAKTDASEDGDEDESEDEEKSLMSMISPSLMSQIGTSVLNQALLVLLDIAREKLKDYLFNRKTTDENS